MRVSPVQCPRKRVQQLKKCKNVVFLDFEKNVKNVSSLQFIRGHTELPKVSNGKSPTSNILLRNESGWRCDVE